MDAVLYIDAAVVTEKVLGRAHKGERVVCVDEGAIVTPTALDYVRQHRMELVRGEVGRQAAAQAVGGSVAAGGELAGEVGCAQPDKCYGCEKEEFGSGYVAPDCCDSCAIRALQLQGNPNAGCEGCNLYKTGRHHGAQQGDALVQQITDTVLRTLEGKG